MKTIVWITTQFVAYHRWPDAKPPVQYLKDFHRHVFHVKLGVEVSHADRQVEFLQLKQRANDYINGSFAEKYFTYSCEEIAIILLRRFKAMFVEVSEDGENGARVEATTSDLLRTKCFIGTEAEGPHKGQRVLFVPGCVTPQRFRKVWELHNDAVSRVYYGAGNDRDLRSDTLNEVRGTLPLSQIDIEVSSIDLGLEDPFVVLDELRRLGATVIVLDEIHPPKWASFVKTIEGNEIKWTSCKTKDIYVTRCDDPLFDQDIYVE